MQRAVRHLRSPGSGLLEQGGRFLLAGGLVALVYIALTALLADVAGLPFALAIALAYAAAVAVHFSLQRFFVWVHHEEFALPFRAQAGRYIAVSGTQLVLAIAVTATLPALLDLPVTAVFLLWTVAVSTVGFVVFGRGVFHPKRPGQPVRRSEQVD